jgi:hypothetical protein
MTRFIRIFGITALAVSISACGGDAPEEKQADKYDADAGLNLSRLVGTTKNPPDEFAVISTAPLQMPEDFASLPAPSPGARSPLAPDPVAEARQALLGESAPQAANVRTSVSESALLSATGPSDPNIRSVLVAEQAEIDADRTEYVLEEVFPSLRGNSEEDLRNTLQPNEERLRLSAAQPATRAAQTGVATIPGAPAPAARLPIIPPATAPASTSSVVTIPAAGSTGEELIFIPE